jgi:hypothetical protein
MKISVENVFKNGLHGVFMQNNDVTFHNYSNGCLHRATDCNEGRQKKQRVTNILNLSLNFSQLKKKDCRELL